MVQNDYDMWTTTFIMWKVLMCLSVLLTIVVTFEQKDYIIDFERMELVSYDKTYLQSAHVVTTKYNRTHPVLNASYAVLVDIGSELQVIAQAYSFLSNEYRLFPLRLGFNFCEAMEKNEFGLATIGNYGNFKKCPIKKGNYYINNWSPDPARFPPHIPNGRYMIELQGMMGLTEIVELKGYGIVSRPLGRRH